MALVPGHVAQRGAELLAPEHRLALVAGMTEIERVRQRGDVFPHQRLVPRIAAASQHDGARADALLAAIGPLRHQAADRAAGVAHQRGDARFRQQRHLRLLGGLAQSVHQLRAAAARQAMHAAVGVAGIVEVVHDAEGQPMRFGEPVDGGRDLARDELDQRWVSAVLWLTPAVGGEGGNVAVGKAGVTADASGIARRGVGNRLVGATGGATALTTIGVGRALTTRLTVAVVSPLPLRAIR